ncbi:MAG TPA: GFA family protein [Myxococcota bacterium]|nr:GFA family protein [Myxococcota bacterium]
MRLSGGCACGAIRYTFEGEPLAALNCHCRDCQRESGSGFEPVLIVPFAGFAVARGKPRHFTVIADSGEPATRNFCGECGSPLFGLPENGVSEIVTIRAGSLDDPSLFRPTRDIYVASAQPWDAMDPALQKIQKLR